TILQLGRDARTRSDLEQTALLCLGQDMLRDMGSGARAAATKAWPVIDVNEVKRPIGSHQTIPTIDVQVQDVARLLSQRVEAYIINGRAVWVMGCEGVEHAVTTYRVEFPLLADKVLLHNGMANATLAQMCQLRWQICGMAYKPHIIRLHSMHIATFDPPSCSALGQRRAAYPR